MEDRYPTMMDLLIQAWVLAITIGLVFGLNYWLCIYGGM